MNKFRFIIYFFIVVFIASCTKDTPDPVLESRSQSADSYDAQIARDWTQTYLDAEAPLPRFRPSATARALGYIHMATFHATYPGIKDQKGMHEVLPQSGIIPFEDWDNEYHWPTAINEAYRVAMSHFILDNTNRASELISRTYATWDFENKKDITLDVYERSKKWGLEAANSIIRYADTDIEALSQISNAVPGDYTPPVGFGLWVASDGNALFPYWGKARTFATFNFDEVLVAPFEPSTDPNSNFFKEAQEVDNTVNNLTKEERWIAEFWSDDIVGLTFSPPARLFAIAEQLVNITEMPLGRTMRFYAKLGMSINDASVICWYGKYKYNIIRPENFIREYINPDFKTILGEAIGTSDVSPSFPAYPSGHSTFASAGSGIFISEFGQSIAFTDRCHEGRKEFAGYPRSFISFAQLAEENAFSRIPLGVHFRMDCVEGLRLGYIVSENIDKLFR